MASNTCEFASCGRVANKYGAYVLGVKVACYCLNHARLVKWILNRGQ